MPLKKILVPLDGSKFADRILGQVRRILLREDAEVRLLRVLPAPLTYEASLTSQRKMVDEAQGHIEAHCKALSDEGARVSFATVSSADPADKILEYAVKYRPSLIAMSTHGRTGLRRWTRGSVAERVLRRSPFPLLLWNPFRSRTGKQATPRFAKILVPLDGSEQSAGILPLVTELARLYESRVLLFYVAEIYPVAGDFPVVQLPMPPKDVARLLEPYRKRLKGISVRTSTMIGTPALSILDVAKKEGADLIAMTTHGRSGLSRWAFGSVAEQVLRHCPYPLLVQRTTGLAEGLHAKTMVAR